MNLSNFEGDSKKRTLTLWIGITFGYILFSVLLHPELIQNLHIRWTTPGKLEFGYLLIVLAIGYGYYLWSSTNEGNQYPTISHRGWLLALFISQLLMLLGKTTGIESLQGLVLIFSWALLLGLLLGSRAGYIALTLSSAVCFALPAWYLLVPYMQEMTAFVAGIIVKIFAINVYINGTYFELPNGIVHVAEGCSGHKYLASSMPIGVLLCLISQSSLYRSASFLSIVLVGALISNWLRVTILIFIANWLGIHHPIMLDHDLLGWIVYGLVMIPIFLYAAPKSRIPPRINRIIPPNPEHVRIFLVATFVLFIPMFSTVLLQSNIGVG